MAISLSVIIPCYNEEQLLASCINSVLQQSNELGPLGEVIIAINGSTDRSLQIANSYKNNPIIKIILLREANKKLAMNTALDIAVNRYIIFFDADSILDNDAISRVNMMLQKNKYAIVGAIRRPIIDIDKVNVRFPETYFMLHYARRLSLKPKDRLSVQGWLMAIDMHKFHHLRFPLDNSPDDIWLSAHTWMNLGSQSIGYIPHAIGSYMPPLTMNDMEKQLLRHRSNHKAVQKFHPELLPYFISRRAYYGTTKSNIRWRRTSETLGINFNVWIVRYRKFSSSIDEKIKLGQYKYGERPSWDRVSSTKLINQK